MLRGAWRSLKLPSSRYLHVATTSTQTPPSSHPSDDTPSQELAEGGVTMTRQNYELIANVIHDFDWGSDTKKHNFAEFMADALATTNPSFDKARFVKAST